MNKNQPLISVIVTTKNNKNTLEACLQSIANQTYKNIEIVVVDNYSTDNTLEIAKKFTKHVFTKGPERSIQRNYAVSKSNGDYVVIIDSDMELTQKVIQACVEKVRNNAQIKGVIIPEESFGKGFWAECKRLERSFYVGVDWMEAARFFEKKIYEKLGGYDEKLISGEDWELSQRIGSHGKIGRISEFIRHNEGYLKLWKTLKKKYYYAQQFASYMAKKEHSKIQSSQTGVLTRYKLFFSRPKQLFTKPHIATGMLFMKTCEFGFGGAGYILAKGRGK